MNDVFNKPDYHYHAYEAYRLFMDGLTAQEVGRALDMPAYAVYKAVALVARDPKPYREAWKVAIS